MNLMLHSLQPSHGAVNFILAQLYVGVNTVIGHAPERVTTDGHASYPRAVRETLGDHVQHRTNKYLNNRLEQDHRGIKQRYYPMHGFGNFEAAARFCCAFDEIRNYLRSRNVMGEASSLYTFFSPSFSVPVHFLASFSDVVPSYAGASEKPDQPGRA